MIRESCCRDKAQAAAYFIGALGSFLIVAGLVWAMRHYTLPPQPDAGRVQERLKFSQEIAQTTKNELESYGYVDPAKDQVRLKIEQAMDMVVSEWKNPAAGRSNLLARVNHFNPPPPPKAPEKPSPFE